MKIAKRMKLVSSNKITYTQTKKANLTLLRQLSVFRLLSPPAANP